MQEAGVHETGAMMPKIPELEKSNERKFLELLARLMEYAEAYGTAALYRRDGEFQVLSPDEFEIRMVSR